MTWSGHFRLQLEATALCLLSIFLAVIPAAFAEELGRDLRDHLKTVIVKGVAKKGSVDAVIDFAGSSLRGKLVSAKAEKISLNYSGAKVDVAWDNISDRRLYGMAVKFADISAAEDLLYLGLAARQMGKAIDAQKFWNRAKKLDAAIASKIEAMRVSAEREKMKRREEKTLKAPKSAKKAAGIPPGQEDAWTPRLSFNKGKSSVVFDVPAIPNTGCSVWCYEDALGKVAEHRKEGEKLILIHKAAGVTATSTFTPSPGRVEHLVVIEGESKQAVKAIRYVNPCTQFGQERDSPPAFGWDRNRDYVDDFVARCFVFLEGGFTLLKDTKRVPGTLPASNKDAPRVNSDKPWIQEYYPVWEEHPGQQKGARGFSTDRPVYPIIGVVSRDGKYLTATVWPETFRLGQVWMPCVHTRPWILKSYDPKTKKTVSRGMYYFLPNDSDGKVLIDAFLKDFPNWESIAHRPKKWR